MHGTFKFSIPTIVGMGYSYYSYWGLALVAG